MPTNVRIIHAREFIRASPGGVLDLEASEKLLWDIAEASRHLPRVEILLDTRKALATLTTTDLWRLAEQAAKHAGPALRKTAVLCPADRFDYAQFLALCGKQHGLDIRAFLDYEHAMEWLISE